MSAYNELMLKHCKVIWCMLETFCFGGLQYGWTSLVFVLKKEGFFSERCEIQNVTAGLESMPMECEHQDAQLSLVYSLANGLSLVPFYLSGTCLSRFGPVKTRIIYTCMFALGCIMMIAASPDIPWFACAGLLFLAGGGIVFLHSNMQITRLYKTGSFIIIALINGCYDSSSAMILFVKLAYDAGISMRISFAIILGLSTTSFLNTYVSFKGISSQASLGDGDKNENEGEREEVKPDEKPEVTLCTVYRKFVCSKTYASHLLWFALVNAHFLFFLSSSNTYITRAVNHVDGSESSLTNFFSIMMFMGVVFSFILGLMLERIKTHMTGNRHIQNLNTLALVFILTSGLSACLGVTAMIRTTSMVYVSFVIFPVFRTLLFTSVHAYNGNMFPAFAFGALASLVNATSSILMFLQRALFQWLQAYDDAELHIRITFVILSVVSLFHPLVILVRTRRSVKKEENGKLTIDSGLRRRSDQEC